AFSCVMLLLPRAPAPTLFPTRRSSDLIDSAGEPDARFPAPAQPQSGQLQGATRIRARTVSALVRACRAARRHLERRRTADGRDRDRKSTRLNSSHVKISYAVFCLKKRT